MKRIFIVFSLLLSSTIHAQVDWQRQAGPEGGYVTDIGYHPSGKTFVIAGGSSRLYVSNDANTGWTLVNSIANNFYFQDIEIDSEGKIYVLTSSDLYRSVDNGVTFQQQPGGFSSGNRIKRVSSTSLVILSSNTVYVSSNDGVSWAQGFINPSGSISNSQLAVNSTGQIFIIKDNKPFRSTDGGLNFSQQSTGIPSAEAVYSLAEDITRSKVYCVSGANMYSSTNGLSWSTIKSGITDATIASSESSFIEFTKDGLGMYFFDNVNRKAYSKTFAAASWSPVATSFPSDAIQVVTKAAGIDFSSSTTAIIFIGTNNGVIKSTTGINTTVDNNSGINGINTKHLIADDFDNLYLSGENNVGLLRSTNQGNTWTRVMALSSDIRKVFTNSTRNTLFSVNGAGDLQRSVDKGLTWPTITKPVAFIWADAADDNRIFGLNSNFNPASFYYSKNLGTSWTASAITITGLPSSFYIYEADIYFASATRMLLSIYNHGTSQFEYWKIDFVYNSSNDITSATASKLTNIPFSSIDSFFASNGNFYFYTNNVSTNNLAVSSNGGTSWILKTTPEQGRELLPANNGYLFLTSNNGGKNVYLSRDNGSSFSTTVMPTQADVFDVTRIVITPSEYAFAGFDGDAVYRTKKIVVVPDAPSSLVNVGMVSTAVSLRWIDNSTNENYFHITRSADGTNFMKIGEISSSDVCNSGSPFGFFVDKSVQPSTSYQYRVFAVNDAGSSPFVQLSVVTPASCLQNVPDNRSWSAVNAGETGLTIVNPAKTVGIKHLGNGQYQISDLGLGIVPGNSSDLPSTFYENCGQTLVAGSFDEDGLKSNNLGTWNGTTTITLKWRACGSDETETITLTLNANDPAPSAPLAAQALVNSNTAIEVSWLAGFYDKTYIVERSLNASSGFVQVGTTIAYPTTSFLDSGPFTDGTIYYYRVKARNGNLTPLESPYSSVASVTFRKPNFVAANNTVSALSAVTLGAYWSDFNSDGFDDYLTMQADFSASDDGILTPVIFKGRSDGGFDKINVTLNKTTYFFASVADYNNDGHPDLGFMATDNGEGFDIYKGVGDFTFNQATLTELGDIGLVADHEVRSSSWSDVNNDGLLDLLLMTYDPGTNTRKTYLFRQNAGNSFTKIPGGSLDTDNGEGNLSIWADYNNDGFQDVFLVDSDGVRLHRNKGDFTFEDVTASAGLTALSSTYSASWADYNNDGNIDLFAGDISSQNKLVKNNGNGTFSVEPATSISEVSVTLGALWSDFNNDGFLDLFTSGFIGYAPRLFLRDATNPTNLIFTKITSEKINDSQSVHYGAGGSDHDKNGFVDIAMPAFKFEDPGDRILVMPNTFYSNNNTTGNWLLVKLEALASNRDAYGALVKVTAGGKTQIRHLSGNSSLASKNSDILHFGLGSAMTVDAIEVKWPSGLIQNLTNRSANQLITVLEEGIPPVATTFLPLNNALSVAIDTKLEISFNENIIASTGKKIEVFARGSSTASFSVNVTSGTITGNKVSFTLPSVLSFFTTYDVAVEAGAFTDQYGNATAAIGWSFVTLDNVAPEITFTPAASVNKGQATTFSPVVTDNSATIQGAVLHYRKIAASTYSTSNGTPSGSVTNQFDFSVAANFFDETGLEYYFTATDPAGNEGRLPAGTGTFKTYINYSLEDSQIPSNMLGFGGTKNSWKIFTIPFELGTNNSVTSVFDELSSLENREDYRLLKYKDQTKWAEFPVDFSTFNRGEGYFVNIKTPEDIQIGNNLMAPANDRANLYQMNLKQGWNMIGNPYLTPISWADVKAYNSLTGSTGDLVKYSAGQYSKTNQNLAAFEGGFVFADAARTVSIPFSGQTSSATRLKDVDFEERDWLLPLTLKYGEFENSFGGVGMHRQASASFDQFDGVNPPRFFDYAELNIEHSEHFAKRFSRDVVPAQREYTWDFEVASNATETIQLLWNNELLRKQGINELYLFDIALQRPIDMMAANNYTFDPIVSSVFRIYYGENLSEKVLPGYASLGKAYPNPSQGLTNFSFTLSERAGQSQHVLVEVLDALGKKVGIVTEGTYQAGFHTVSWDASQAGSGVYTYRLLVNGRMVKNVENGKLVIR